MRSDCFCASSRSSSDCCFCSSVSSDTPASASFARPGSTTGGPSAAPPPRAPACRTARGTPCSPSLVVLERWKNLARLLAVGALLPSFFKIILGPCSRCSRPASRRSCTARVLADFMGARAISGSSSSSRLFGLPVVQAHGLCTRAWLPAAMLMLGHNTRRGQRIRRPRPARSRRQSSSRARRARAAEIRRFNEWRRHAMTLLRLQTARGRKRATTRRDAHTF